MKITRVVLKDFEGWYDEHGVLIFDGPLPDAKKLLQALGHEIQEEVNPRHSVAYLGNSMPMTKTTLDSYFKTHSKLK